MFLSVYCLKSLISVGIVVTLLLGIALLYILVYAFLISSVTAQILPDFRNGFIATFMATSVLMILSSLSGIYGLVRKKNKFVIGYSVTMLIYFIIFVVLAAFLIKYPASLREDCSNQSETSTEIRKTVDKANQTLGKTCRTYFTQYHIYTDRQKQILNHTGFTNYSPIDNELPINAENCDSWDNNTDFSTNSIIFLQSVFNCSGWCQVQPEFNLYFLFTGINRGKPKETCIESLLAFFQKFGHIMQISCMCVGFFLFLILMNIVCLCCHPDRGQEYDALKFFKSTLLVELNEEQESKRNIDISSV